MFSDDLERNVSKPPIRRLMAGNGFACVDWFSKPPIRRLMQVERDRKRAYLSKPPIRRLMRCVA